MIGTHPSGHGGVASVCKMLMESPLKSEFNLAFIATHSSSGRLLAVCFYCVAIFRLLYELAVSKIGFVHFHLASRGSFLRKYLLAKLCARFGCSYIVHLHGAEFDLFYTNECDSKRQQRVRWLFEHAEVIVVLGERWSRWVNSEFNCKRIEIIYNASNLPSIFKEVNSPTSKSSILFLGRIGTRKGVHDLLRAFQTVRQSYPEVELLLGGDGDQTEFLQQAQQLQLGNSVRFLGWVGFEQKQQLLREAAVYVLPSYNEGFPVGIVEAMAFSLPIVATTVGGIPDAIESGKHGILVPPGDVIALEQALITLFNDREFATELGRAALNRYQTTFSRDVVIGHWTKLYRSLQCNRRSGV